MNRLNLIFRIIDGSALCETTSQNKGMDKNSNFQEVR
jgi:hypothetical protein